MKRQIHYRLLPLVLLLPLLSCNQLRNWKYNPPNVLLISVEGLSRALPCYGDTTFQSPNIDRLAMRAVVFDDALAQHPASRHALTSIFTGLYPEHFQTMQRDSLYLTSLFPGLESGDYRIALPGHTKLQETLIDPVRITASVKLAQVDETGDIKGNSAVSEKVLQVWSKYDGDPFFINAHYQMQAILQDSNKVVYQEALLEVDKEVGRLLDQLMGIQEASNTIVILLGVNPGGSGATDLKRDYFKPQYVKVPMLYYDFRQDSSRRVPQLTELRSLFPTLAERCFMDGQKVHGGNAPTVQQVLDGDFRAIQYTEFGISNSSRYHALYTIDHLYLTEDGGSKELFYLDGIHAEQRSADSVLMDSLETIYQSKNMLSATN